MRSRLTYANVMATLACFVALGGGAYAASKIDSGDIAKNAVLSKHIKNNKVKGSDVKESSLKGVAPLAYAHIVGDAVVAADSRGVTLEADAFPHRYCLRVTGDPKNVQATVDSESLDIAIASLDPGDACSDSADALVRTGDGAGSFIGRDVFILFH